MTILSVRHRRAALAVSCAVLMTWLCSASAAPVSILTNGVSSNRVDIAVLAEGFTASQSNQFIAAATDAIEALLSEPPFSDYSNHFNAVALFVASVESGSDHPQNSQAESYFNSTYGPQNGPIITIPPNWANPNYADGQGKVDTLLAAQAPDADLVLLLVNDLWDGGSDGGGGLVIASKGAVQFGTGILQHEVGHVLANLGDEYEWPNPGYPDIEEPNTTRETNRAAVKWNAWIAPSTPVPTPETATYKNVVGLFEGAHYSSTNWYRPRFDCRMRTTSRPFCEVCGEALVLRIYQDVRPVESWMPADTNVGVTTPDPVSFDLTLLQPAHHTLTVQWTTNGVPVAGATSAQFTVDPAQLGNGLHTIEAEIIDPTQRVRTDPNQRTQQTVTWPLNIAIPWLRLEEPAWTADAFRFRLVGSALNGFVVESSTNLTDWVSVATNQLVNGEAWFTNATPGNPSGFHRALAQP